MKQSPLACLDSAGLGSRKYLCLAVHAVCQVVSWSPEMSMSWSLEHTVRYFTFKRGLVGCINVRMPRHGDCPGLSGWTRFSIRVLVRWDQEGQSGEVMWQWKEGERLADAMLAAGLEDGGGANKPTSARCLLQPEMVRNQSLPWCLQEDCSPEDPLWTSDLWNYNKFVLVLSL